MYLALRGLSQRALAGQVGLPEGDLSRWLRKGTPFAQDVAERIAAALGCTLADFRAA